MKSKKKKEYSWRRYLISQQGCKQRKTMHGLLDYIRPSKNQQLASFKESTGKETLSFTAS